MHVPIALNFIKISLKLSYFLSKIDKIFERWWLRFQTLETAFPQLQISGYAPESNHFFALLIFMPPEFSLMPGFKSINFYQNKPNIKFICKKTSFFRALGAPHPDPQWYPADRAELPGPRNSPFPLQIFDYSPDIKRVLLILSSCRVLQWEVIEQAKQQALFAVMTIFKI